MRLSVGMSEKWDQRPETRDPSCEWDLGSETHDPIGGTQDRRPGTQLIGGTRDPKDVSQNPQTGTLIFYGTLTIGGT